MTTESPRRIGRREMLKGLGKAGVLFTAVASPPVAAALWYERETSRVKTAKRLIDAENQLQAVYDQTRANPELNHDPKTITEVRQLGTQYETTARRLDEIDGEVFHPKETVKFAVLSGSTLATGIETWLGLGLIKDKAISFLRNRNKTKRTNTNRINAS